MDCVQPSLHSDLADEDEHVERAGLGHAHHEREVLDMPRPQLQPAAASVIMLDTHRLRHIGAAARRWPAALSTSSSINTAVGEMTARTTIEHS